MELELAQLTGVWPMALPVVAAASARGVIAGRRRSALNEALHELRRPLQALALSASAASGAKAGGLESSLRMATAALERLDREINGEALATSRAPFAVGPLLDEADQRWRRRAELAGRSLRLRCAAAGMTVGADRREIAQALDNLIDNALEHGGGGVEVVAAAAAGVCRISVTDAGGEGRRRRRRPGPKGLLARVTGRCRRGHGLRVVRRVASAHGGGFRLRISRAGCEAELELPLLAGGAR